MMPRNDQGLEEYASDSNKNPLATRRKYPRLIFVPPLKDSIDEEEKGFEIGSRWLHLLKPRCTVHPLFLGTW